MIMFFENKWVEEYLFKLMVPELAISCGEKWTGKKLFLLGSGSYHYSFWHSGKKGKGRENSGIFEPEYGTGEKEGSICRERRACKTLLSHFLPNTLIVGIFLNANQPPKRQTAKATFSSSPITFPFERFPPGE